MWYLHIHFVWLNELFWFGILLSSLVLRNRLEQSYCTPSRKAFFCYKQLSTTRIAGGLLWKIFRFASHFSQAHEPKIKPQTGSTGLSALNFLLSDYSINSFILSTTELISSSAAFSIKSQFFVCNQDFLLGHSKCNRW